MPLGAKTVVSVDIAPNPVDIFENPVVAREDVLYIPIFPPELMHDMTTFPFGKSTPEPKRPMPCPAIGPTFVRARVFGLNIPIFAEPLGTMTTFPVGLRTAP